MTVMGYPIEQRCRHLGIPKDLRPLGKAQVGCNNHTGALIQLGQQVKQECAACPGAVKVVAVKSSMLKRLIFLVDSGPSVFAG